MRLIILLCVCFFRFNIFSQDDFVFSQNNDLNSIFKESITSVLKANSKIVSFQEDNRNIFNCDNNILLDSIFLNIDNLPYQIELENMPRVCYYSDMSFRVGGMRQVSTKNNIYKLKQPVKCWNIGLKIVGKYCIVTIEEFLLEAHRRRFIKEAFRFAPLVRYNKTQHFYEVFEYDFQTEKWINSNTNLMHINITNEKNIVNIAITETINDFIEHLVSNNIFDKDCYSAISIDGLPLSYDNTTPESYWEHFVDELNLSHNVALDWYNFVDINNSNFTNKSYKNKILNGSHIIAPQICLNGDNLIITISYRKIDAKGYYDKLLAIGRYLYTLDSKSTNGEWKIKNNLFELTVP